MSQVSCSRKTLSRWKSINTHTRAQTHTHTHTHKRTHTQRMFTGIHLCWSLFLCFPVNMAKYSLFVEHCWWLPLYSVSFLDYFLNYLFTCIICFTIWVRRYISDVLAILVIFLFFSVFLANRQIYAETQRLSNTWSIFWVIKLTPRSDVWLSVRLT